MNQEVKDETHTHARTQFLSSPEVITVSFSIRNTDSLSFGKTLGSFHGKKKPGKK